MSSGPHCDHGSWVTAGLNHSLTVARPPLGLLLLGAFGFNAISSDMALRSENVLVTFIRGPGTYQKAYRLLALLPGSEACCFRSLGLSFLDGSNSTRFLALWRTWIGQRLVRQSRPPLLGDS